MPRRSADSTKLSAKRRASRPTGERLRASPSFALAFTLDGRPYIAKETEPYVQYWLSERYRLLLAMFSGRYGATVDEAIEQAMRLAPGPDASRERSRLLRAVKDMHESGVLISHRDDTSRYDASIVQDYVTHRPFPRELSDQIIRDASIARNTRVLDLAGGPGDLALAMARASDEVSLMELSKGFVRAAARRARDQNLKLITIHESCNRLMYLDDELDVVTVSQALHWLDDVMICRGLCKLLSTRGSFFVVHAGFEVADTHPLSFVLGRRSALGHRIASSFADQVQALLDRLRLLFEALDAPQVHRIDPAQRWTGDLAGQRIAPAGVAFYRQPRPMGPGFARGFLTDSHIASLNMSTGQFWEMVDQRCRDTPEPQLIGHFDWAVLHFQRGAPSASFGPLADLPVRTIGFPG